MADLNKSKKARESVIPSVPVVNMDAHVKLQQSQEEFLKWLDDCEKHSSEHDGYSYKKVR